MNKYLIFLILITIIPFSSLSAEFIVDLQGGSVFTEYNDVRIPGDNGTKFSLSDDLKADTAWSARSEAGYLYKRHYIGVLAAPLRVNSSGRINRNINFNGKMFSAGEKLNARFRFDSYRMTYRYTVYQGEIFNFGAGLTAKIRDASISLESDTASAEKKNTGFVPLINFAVEAKLPADFYLLIAGDALASPQGRAEDIAFLAGYKINDMFKIKAGYRFLEGGADNDEVYTFSMFHYAVLGVNIIF